MKRFLCVLVVCVMLFSAVGLTGCAGDKEPTVVCTIFPLYDFARQLLGDAVNIKLLNEGGTDIHGYNPSVADIAAIKSAALLLCVGGESDGWAFSAVSGIDVPSLPMFSVLTGKREENPAGVEGVESDGGNDEHLWLSIKNAVTYVEALAVKLASVFPELADTILANKESYVANLQSLDNAYQQVMATAPMHILMFADRFPFRYLADDYGLTCYAAFAGCSTDSDASFQTVSYLGKTLKEMRLPALLILENNDGKLADTICGAAGLPATKVLTVYSMQSVSRRDIQEGATYIGYMTRNLTAIKEALGA